MLRKIVLPSIATELWLLMQPLTVVTGQRQIDFSSFSSKEIVGRKKHTGPRHKIYLLGSDSGAPHLTRTAHAWRDARKRHRQFAPSNNTF
jgi:hypothetical protein